MVRRRRVAAAGTLGLLSVGVGWLLGMRAKESRVVATQRRVNRALFNPWQLRTAGTPGAYAAVVRHTGRCSGRPYETPVGAVPTDDGFVVALIYGSTTDWVRNVLAAGHATVVHEGVAHSVDRPEILPVDAMAVWFSEGDLRSFRLFAVTQCLRLRAAAAG